MITSDRKMELEMDGWFICTRPFVAKFLPEVWVVTKRPNEFPP